jgi:hypothetical protein
MSNEKTAKSEGQQEGDLLNRIVRDCFTDCAWLHRRQRTTWLFQPDPRYGRLSHTTRAGTTYVIVPGLEDGKPFWIGQVAKNAVFTVESYLRAREIEFANALTMRISNNHQDFASSRLRVNQNYPETNL